MADVEIHREGARLRIVLNAAHGNAISDAMVAAIREITVRLKPDPTLASIKLVTFESAGKDFSFGAALDEHTPARMPDVLPRFHQLIRDLLHVPAVTAAVVTGRCLGGGFEIALACDVIFASDDAELGLPEIKVAAFPPAGSILLPLKAGASRAASAILTGAPRSANEWHAAGLIEMVVPRVDLASAVDRWFQAGIARHSAAALRRAVFASRLTVSHAVGQLLPVAERLYLDDLLKTADCAEGIDAFLGKRPPKWTDS